MSSGVTVAFFGFIFFLVKTIMSLITYISWVRKSIRTTGKIVDVTKTINAYSKKKSQSTKYVYDIEILDDNISHTNVKLTEFTTKDKLSRFDVDDDIDLFYRQSSHEVASVMVLKNKCLEFFLGIFICAGIILLCYYIAIQNGF